VIVRFLLLLAIATNAYANNLYLSINEILLSKNTVLEHYVYNQINQVFESSSGYINRTSEEITIVMTEPSNETYSLFDSYIEYCDLDFNECSTITEPQIINSPFFKIISDGLKEDNVMNDILIFNQDIELADNTIKIYQDVNLIELTYYDSLGILNKIKISKI
jgi:hypothetical protein